MTFIIERINKRQLDFFSSLYICYTHNRIKLQTYGLSIYFLNRIDWIQFLTYQKSYFTSGQTKAKLFPSIVCASFWLFEIGIFDQNNDMKKKWKPHFTCTGHMTYIKDLHPVLCTGSPFINSYKVGSPGYVVAAATLCSFNNRSCQKKLLHLHISAWFHIVSKCETNYCCLAAGRGDCPHPNHPIRTVLLKGH